MAVALPRSVGWSAALSEYASLSSLMTGLINGGDCGRDRTGLVASEELVRVMPGPEKELGLSERKPGPRAKRSWRFVAERAWAMPAGGVDLPVGARARCIELRRLMADDCWSWICWSKPWSYNRRLVVVVERLRSGEPMGADEGGKAGDEAGMEFAPCEAIDVAAVEVRVLTGPELVEDVVSLLRLTSEGLEGSEWWLPSSSCWNSSSSSASRRSRSFSSCRKRWYADMLTSSS